MGGLRWTHPQPRADKRLLNCFHTAARFSIEDSLDHTKGSILGRFIPGGTISHYHIIEKIGEGGMGRNRE